MSKYANENTLKYIEVLKNASNADGKNKGCYENPIYKSFFEGILEHIYQKCTRKLPAQPKVAGR